MTEGYGGEKYVRSGLVAEIRLHTDRRDLQMCDASLHDLIGLLGVRRD